MFVPVSTVNLDGVCPNFLQLGRMPNAADSLRALRESLPGKPGVREVARVLGYDMPNTYGYYESRAFKKQHLPLDKAREFAAAFQELGGDPADVLALAGLGADEKAHEAARLRHEPDPYQLLPFNVAFPSEDALTETLSGLLDSIGVDPDEDERARKLARQLPGALRLAATHRKGFRLLRSRVREEAAFDRDEVRSHS